MSAKTYAPVASETASYEVLGWVLYDADCAFCSAWAGRLRIPLARRGFVLTTLRNPQLPVPVDPALLASGDEMKIVTPDGAVSGGADAVVQLAHRIWWLWPLVAVARIPGGLPMLRGAYRWIARNRHRLGGSRSCRVPADSAALPRL